MHRHPSWGPAGSELSDTQLEQAPEVRQDTQSKLQKMQEPVVDKADVLKSRELQRHFPFTTSEFGS